MVDQFSVVKLLEDFSQLSAKLHYGFLLSSRFGAEQLIRRFFSE